MSASEVEYSMGWGASQVVGIDEAAGRAQINAAVMAKGLPRSGLATKTA